MLKLNFRSFTFTAILTIVGSTIEAEIYNIHYSIGCPIGGSGCYHAVISGTRMTWAEAQEACQNLNYRADSLRLETNKVKIKLGIFMSVQSYLQFKFTIYNYNQSYLQFAIRN